MTIEGGDKLVLQGPSSGVHFMTIVLPAKLSFSIYPYLTMRVRATAGSCYSIRPMLDGTPAYDNDKTFWRSALEARRGYGTDGDAGWEILTLNMRTQQQIYQPPAREVNWIGLVIAPDPANPPGASTIRLEIDYMGVHCGITPDSVQQAETIFTDGLDDDGDGLVDRDDDQFREKYPRMVLANYQSLYSSLARGGFKGKRKPGDGGGPVIDIDPSSFSPAVPGKRNIPCTFYPLDFVRNPSYEPPANYNQFFDQDQNGVWSPCTALQLPPTEQFTSLDYGLLGAVEEYDDQGPDWITAEAGLARKYGVDGFVHDDSDVADSIGVFPSYRAMASTLGGLATGAWASKPFGFASFYGIDKYDPAIASSAVQKTIADLTNIVNAHVSLSSAYVKYGNKPLIFVYPMMTPLRLTPAQWEQIYQGLLNPMSQNYDGALSVPSATPNNPSANRLEFEFSAYQSTGGNAFSGQVDYLEWYDKNMQLISSVDFGSPEARSLFESGFGPDYPATAQEPFTYTFIQSPVTSSDAGEAEMRISIPANAFYLKLRIKGLDQAMTGQPIQSCTLRINSGSGVTFPEVVGWASYLFRLRDLPPGFEENTAPDAPLAELPMSLWGQEENLIRRTDDSVHSRGFDGLAQYTSQFRDVRTEVSYPCLRADTVRPAFDDSGNTYYCTQRPNFLPRNGDRWFRTEWEQLIADGPDMAVVTSWNEFSEGTNIEPDIEHGFQALRVTQTYALIYKGLVETARFPSATGFLVKRFDTEGASRAIQFEINGSDTIRICGQRFGQAGAAISSITRNGVALALGSADASVEAGSLCPVLTINTPNGQSLYEIQYTDGSNSNAADLSLRVCATPWAVNAGDSFTHRITVTNNGPNSATGVRIADTIPAGAAFVSASREGFSVAGNAVSGCLPDMARGESIDMQIVMRAPAASSSLGATVSVTSNEQDPKPSDNSRVVMAVAGSGSVPSPTPTPTPTTGPDLTGYWVKTAAVCKKQCQIKARFTVQNVGDQKAANVPGTIAYYLSDDAVFSPETDALLKFGSTGVLKPGKSKSKNLRAKLTEPATGKYLLAVLDQDGNFEELDETNNVIVSDPLP